MRVTVKKAMAVGVAILLSVLSFTACSSTNGSTGDVKNTPEISTPKGQAGNDNQGITNNSLAFEKLDDASLPEAAVEAVEKLKSQRGFTWFKTDDAYVLLVFMGEKNTGGYGIEVKAIEDIEGLTKVTIQETEPAEDASVITVLTYPYTAVKFKGAAENFEVVNEKGEKFSLLSSEGNLEDPLAMEATGTYVGQVDGNSIEIIVDQDADVEERGQTAVFRFTDEVKAYFDREAKEFKDFQKNDRMKFSYIRNNESQLIILRLEKI